VDGSGRGGDILVDSGQWTLVDLGEH